MVTMVENIAIVSVQSTRFLERLMVRSEDAYWMPDPSIAVGGIRVTAATFEMRVDATSETLQMLLEGLAIEDEHRAINGHHELIPAQPVLPAPFRPT